MSDIPPSNSEGQCSLAALQAFPGPSITGRSLFSFNPGLSFL